MAGYRLRRTHLGKVVPDLKRITPFEYLKEITGMDLETSPIETSNRGVKINPSMRKLIKEGLEVLYQ